QVAPRADPCVDALMQRLDAPAEHLGRLGHLLDPRHLEAVLLEERRRAARRHELEPELREPAREHVHSLLLVHRDQRAHRLATTSGSRRCSTAWMRCSSVARGSSGTGSWRMTGPVSRPSSTKCTVTPVVSTPAASASSIARAPGKAGRSEGWTLTMRPGKRSRNGVVSSCM